MPDGEIVSVLLGLAYAFGDLLVFRLGLDHRQPLVAILLHLVGGKRFASLALTLQPAQRDGKLPPRACAFDHAPSRLLQGWIDQFGAGLGFVPHLPVTYSWPVKA